MAAFHLVLVLLFLFNLLSACSLVSRTSALTCSSFFINSPLAFPSSSSRYFSFNISSSSCFKFPAHSFKSRSFFFLSLLLKLYFSGFMNISINSSDWAASCLYLWSYSFIHSILGDKNSAKMRSSCAPSFLTVSAIFCIWRSPSAICIIASLLLLKLISSNNLRCFVHFWYSSQKLSLIFLNLSRFII